MAFLFLCIKERLKSDAFIYYHFHPFLDRFQVSSSLLAETEEVRQNISKLSKEVWSIWDPTAEYH